MLICNGYLCNQKCSYCLRGPSPRKVAKVSKIFFLHTYLHKCLRIVCVKFQRCRSKSSYVIRRERWGMLVADRGREAWGRTWRHTKQTNEMLWTITFLANHMRGKECIYKHTNIHTKRNAYKRSQDSIWLDIECHALRRSARFSLPLCNYAGLSAGVL